MGKPAAAGVYPRVCGGTAESLAKQRGYRGLSPRVRGNRNERVNLVKPLRSIPACAGEPTTGAIGGYADGVYPRVCGGTAPAPALRTTSGGLSPRVRGNRQIPRYDFPDVGSIPACAGEPYRR